MYMLITLHSLMDMFLTTHTSSIFTEVVLQAIPVSDYTNHEMHNVEIY